MDFPGDETVYLQTWKCSEIKNAGQFALMMEVNYSLRLSYRLFLPVEEFYPNTS